MVYVDEADGGLSVDVDHLADVFAAVPRYRGAWEDYEARHRPPSGDEDGAYERWQAGGPEADDLMRGLSDLLVMSSGEVAALRLLATLGSTRIPFKVSDLVSLDAEGQHLLADWCTAVTA